MTLETASEQQPTGGEMAALVGTPLWQWRLAAMMYWDRRAAAQGSQEGRLRLRQVLARQSALLYIFFPPKSKEKNVNPMVQI
jgi:hypothetical protein